MTSKIHHRYRVKVMHNDGDTEEYYFGGTDPDDVLYSLAADSDAFDIVKILQIIKDDPNGL